VVAGKGGMLMTVEWAVIVAVLLAGFFVFAYGLGFMAGVRDEQAKEKRNGRNL
jgi:hypothetical protein